MRVSRKSPTITALSQAGRVTPAPLVARPRVAVPSLVVPSLVAPSLVATSHGGVMVAALLALVGACSRPAPGMEQQAPAEPPAPTSATFQLAPLAAATTAPKPAPSPAPSVLAATVPDAMPPSSAAAEPGSPSAGCINGWFTPERGNPLRSAALDMMRERADERFIVEEMRYFVGPEDAEVVGRRGEVERWYVQAFTDAEPRRRQRWLVRRAPVGSGVDAIAPFDSNGYGPRTWRRPDASDPSLADPFERPCQGTKPGEVCMGLPREVLGCLSGT